MEGELGSGMVGIFIFGISIIISIILCFIGGYRNERSKILVSYPILMVIIFIQILIVNIKHKHGEETIIDKRDMSTIKASNLNLAKIIKDDFNNLGIENYGKIIFEQTTANEFCNRSEYLIVYAYDGDDIDICNKIVKKFDKYIDYNRIPNKQPECWSRTNNNNVVINNKIQNISNRITSSSGNINDRGIDTYRHFKLSFFQKESAHPYFIPVSYFYEGNIIDYIKKNNYKFYYIHIQYQGEYDKGKYDCDYGADYKYRGYCECLTRTYTHTIFDGQDEEKLRINQQFLPMENIK